MAPTTLAARPGSPWQDTRNAWYVPILMRLVRALWPGDGFRPDAYGFSGASVSARGGTSARSATGLPDDLRDTAYGTRPSLNGPGRPPWRARL
jgi:hypothetical protein